MARKTKTGGLDASEILRRAEKAFAFTSEERNEHLASVSYIEGEQWVSAQRGRLEKVSMDRCEGDRFPLVMDNQLGPELDRQAARVLTPLSFEVPAQAADDASRQAAHIASTIVRHTAHEHRWEELDRDIWYATRAGGCAAMFILWDANAGNGLGVTDDGKPFGTGDVRYVTADIGEFAVDPGVRHAVKARWAVLRQALPPAEVKDLYDLPDLPKPDAATPDSFLRHPGEGATELTRVITYFERPSGSSKGGVHTVVGTDIVDSVEWPYPFSDELPMELCRPVPRARRWTGRSNVWDALRDQTLINYYESHKAAHARDASMTPLIVDGAFDQDLPNAPGGVLRVTPDPMGGFKPEYLRPPPISEAVLAGAEEARGRLKDKLGTSDVMGGEAPSGVTAASAFAVLVEQGNLALTQMSMERARFWGRIASKTLKLYEAKVRAPEPRRKASIVTSRGATRLPLIWVERDSDGSPKRDENGREVVVEGWRGEDLLGHTHVEMPLSRALPRNRAAAIAFADTLQAAGYITDAQTYLAAAEIEPDSEVLHIINADWERAEEENHRFAAGRPCLVEEWDDDAVHIEAHTRFFKSARWYQLPEDAQNLAREHLQQHETAAAEKAGKLAAKMATSPALAAAPGGARNHEGVEEALLAASQAPEERLPGMGGVGAPPGPVPPEEATGPSPAAALPPGLV